MAGWRKYKKQLIAAAVLVLLVIWGIRVVQFNREIQALDGEAVEDIPIGEYASFDHNYTYGNYSDGYSMRVNDYVIMDTEDYLAGYGQTAEDYSFSQDRVCLVDVTVRNDGAPKGVEVDGLYLNEIWLYGLDYYEGQSQEFFDLENPELAGTVGITLDEGQEYDLTLVFNIDKRYYTARSWDSMDQLPMKLYLTAYPVQKNLVLQ